MASWNASPFNLWYYINTSASPPQKYECPTVMLLSFKLISRVLTQMLKYFFQRKNMQSFQFQKSFLECLNTIPVLIHSTTNVFLTRKTLYVISIIHMHKAAVTYLKEFVNMRVIFFCVKNRFWHLCCRRNFMSHNMKLCFLR